MTGPDEACLPEETRPACYLTVTSMAFRSWNHGVAVALEGGEPSNFGVWTYNGSEWRPNPSFAGVHEECKGNTVLWAGKLDYWVIGGAAGERGGRWSDLCRYDGETLSWEPLEFPREAETRLHYEVEFEGRPVTRTRYGTITSGACFAWNNCWFFGTYGTVLHWNGEVLTNASAEPPLGLLGGELTGAAAREGPAGEELGLAVGATAPSVFSAEGPYSGAPTSRSAYVEPPELYSSTGGAFSALILGELDLSPYAVAQAEDPFRTDLDAQYKQWRVRFRD